jgi:hypothetical protein
MVICLTISALPEALLVPVAELDPGFFSKIFQNFKLSSAAKEALVISNRTHNSFTNQLSQASVHRD